MPTVLRLDGLRVVIYPNDHRPPHVHVIGAGNQAVFEVEVEVTLRENYGFTLRELRSIERALSKHLVELRFAWGSIHG